MADHGLFAPAVVWRALLAAELRFRLYPRSVGKQAVARLTGAAAYPALATLCDAAGETTVLAARRRPDTSSLDAERNAAYRQR